jgi:hypothetical protein
MSREDPNYRDDGGSNFYTDFYETPNMVSKPYLVFIYPFITILDFFEKTIIY